MAMNHNFRKANRRAVRGEIDAGGIDDLLHPAQAFAHPSDVVDDPDLTLNEKRAILASWASDACAEKVNPMQRRTANGKTASWDEIMDALKELDLQASRAGLIRFDPDLFWWPRRGLQGGSGGGPDRGSRAA
jgi:hypothetical protein